MKVESTQSFATFHSIDAAIANARGLQDRADLTRATEQLRGSLIEQVSWSDRRVDIAMSSGCSIVIYVLPNTVGWKIGDSHALTGAEPPRVLQLQFPSDRLPWNWRRAEILEQRLGHRFTRIFASDFGVFLYVEGCEILLFNSIAVEGELDGLLLFWDNAE